MPATKKDTEVVDELDELEFILMWAAIYEAVCI